MEVHGAFRCGSLQEPQRVEELVADAEVKDGGVYAEFFEQRDEFPRVIDLVLVARKFATDELAHHDHLGDRRTTGKNLGLCHERGRDRVVRHADTRDKRHSHSALRASTDRTLPNKQLPESSSN